MYDAFFYEAFAEEEAALRRFLAPDLRCGFTWKTIQEYANPAPESKLISIRTQSVIPLAWSGALRAILSRSTGYDHLSAYQREAQQPPDCGYLPLYCHRAVAEHAMLLWMALLRRLPSQIAQFEQFQRDGLTGSEAQGRNLLVVGVGNIGHEVMKIGRALDMRARGVDVCHKHHDVDYGSIDELLPWADVMVCAMNLTKQNYGYFNLERLSLIKPGAIFVNVARGELAPAVALLSALEAGYLGGVGLDVYNEESLLATSLRDGQRPTSREACAVFQMAQKENVILTPHNAFNTLEAVTRKAQQSAQQVSAWLKQGAFIWHIP